MMVNVPPLKRQRLEGKDIVESSVIENLDGSVKPQVFPAEVWANIINCEYHV